MTNALRELRTMVGATQSQFADRMGVKLRTLEDLEAERAGLRPVHMKAAQFAAIEFVMDRGGFDKLPVDLRNFIRSAHLQLKEETGE